MKISVVISSFNGMHLLRKYLPPLLGAMDELDYEIIIVDDGSKDNTDEFIQREYPSIKLVRLDKNRGFAIANNTGAEMSCGDIILFLNNDMKVTDNFLTPISKYFESSDIFAVSPKVLLPKYDNKINEGLSRASFYRGLFSLEFPDTGRKRSNTGPMFTLYASGGAMAVDRKKFLSLGGFDDMFSPFYCEDMDISYRAWKRGWKVVYEPNAVVYHYHQSTIGKVLNQKGIDIVTGKNQLLFMWKNLTDNRLFLSHWLWLPRNIVGGLRMRSSALLRNFIYALPQLPLALRARRIEKSLSVKQDWEILTKFSGRGFPMVHNKPICGACGNNKTLVIMPQSLGDVYQMTAIVDGLNKRYPNKKIDFMTKKRCSDILEANPYIEKVIPYPEDGENPYYAVEIDRLRERDKLINDYEEIYTPYYGFQLSYEELMRNRGTGKNMVELFAEFCGLTREEIGRPYLKEERFQITESSYIVLHPQTLNSAKNWDYFRALVNLLLKDGFTLCQVGLNGDKLLKGCKDYRGLSLGKLGYLLRNARLFIGIDSFPAHLSSGVGTKTIVLYGGTDANFCKPYWGDVVTIEPDRSMFGCKNACHAKDCSKRRKCINGIKPKEVYEKVI
ncbi:glycosyltransferase [candidate division WOR-3 bacterium]|nr:glycosyltransferase [candidate division WOR-3 bacterium]